MIFIREAREWLPEVTTTCVMAGERGSALSRQGIPKQIRNGRRGVIGPTHPPSGGASRADAGEGAEGVERVHGFTILRARRTPSASTVVTAGVRVVTQAPTERPLIEGTPLASTHDPLVTL